MPDTTITADHAFETTTMPHLEAVARFALSLTRDRADADDLVQQTYLLALRGWSTFRPGSDALRWLFTICRNAFLRAEQRRRRIVESEDGDLDAMPVVLTHARLMFDGRADLFERIDVRPAIERSIAALPEPHHTILVLIDLEDHSYEEAAAILGVPVGTVRSRLYRARRMIQEALIAYAEDAGIAPRPRRVGASTSVDPANPRSRA